MQDPIELVEARLIEGNYVAHVPPKKLEEKRLPDKAFRLLNCELTADKVAFIEGLQKSLGIHPDNKAHATKVARWNQNAERTCPPLFPLPVSTIVQDEKIRRLANDAYWKYPR